MGAVGGVGVDVAHHVGRHWRRARPATAPTSSWRAPPPSPVRGRRRCAGAGDGDPRLARRSSRRRRRPAHSARRDWRISRRRTCRRRESEIQVMISPSSSAVANRPLKKSSAAILRLLVTIVAPSASRRPDSRRRIVVGDRAADGAAIAHVRIADELGELGTGRESRRARPARSRPRHASSWRR